MKLAQNGRETIQSVKVRVHLNNKVLHELVLPRVRRVRVLGMQQPPHLMLPAPSLKRKVRIRMTAILKNSEKLDRRTGRRTEDVLVRRIRTLNRESVASGQGSVAELQGDPSTVHGRDGEGHGHDRRRWGRDDGWRRGHRASVRVPGIHQFNHFKNNSRITRSHFVEKKLTKVVYLFLLILFVVK